MTGLQIGRGLGQGRVYRGTETVSAPIVVGEHGRGGRRNEKNNYLKK